VRPPSALVLFVGILLLAGCAQKTAAPATSPASTTSSAPSTGPATGKGEWAAVACGSYHTLALKQNGTLWAWGLNDYGQLGQGTIDGSAHATPTQVGHAHDWAAVSCGYGDSFAVKKDGTLWAWGNNTDFAANLGLGDREERYSPTRVGHARDWTAVHYGYFHGLALKKDGTLWGWGSNFYGALAVGNNTFVWAPAKVAHDRNWAAAAGGGGYSLALKKDGTLWAWGGNTFGELGLGDTAERHSPTKVGSATDWAAVCCLGHHSLALKKDGTLWAWGENCYGQLGVGDTTDRHSPTQVGTSRDWAAIAPGAADSYHTVAVKRDGTLWAWGFNRFGQLGLDDTTDRHVPTRVGTR
jgi:alpha-tubulin suppressor-like RCC1 family protein